MPLNTWTPFSSAPMTGPVAVMATPGPGRAARTAEEISVSAPALAPALSRSRRPSFGNAPKSMTSSSAGLLSCDTRPALTASVFYKTGRRSTLFELRLALAEKCRDPLANVFARIGDHHRESRVVQRVLERGR